MTNVPYKTITIIRRMTKVAMVLGLGPLNSIASKGLSVMSNPLLFVAASSPKVDLTVGFEAI
jgi:hypothetical protein